MIDARTGWYFDHVSVKAVVLRDDGTVLLGLNGRGEWELPGGWPGESDRTLEDALVREVREEAGIVVRPVTLVAAELYQAAPGERVVLVSFLAREVPGSDGEVRISSEHSNVGYYRPGDVVERLPEVYVRHIEIARRAAAHG